MGMLGMIVLAVLAAVVLFFVVVMVADGSRFVVREYYFCNSNFKKNAKVVLLSDLHNKEYGHQNRNLWNAIELAAPDIILVAGDMLTATKGRSFAPAVTFLTALAEKYPVYYGNGNHEYRLRHYPEQYGSMAAEYEKALAPLSLERLLNQHQYLSELNMTIYGLDLERIYYKRTGKSKMTADYLTETLGKPDRGQVNLLIAHNPEYFKEYAAWGADLVVSGHVHGGVLRLPFLGGVISPRLRLFPEYDGGLFHEEKATMVLSRGLGSHTLPVRIFNPGELVVIHLRQ